MKKRDLPQTSQPLLSRWLFVLIGQNDSGKTSFQRHLIDYLCDRLYVKLPRDTAFEVRHPRAPRNFATIACANRSYQEKRAENGTVENYILRVVPDADVTLVASHAGPGDISDVQDVLRFGRRRGYNMAAVFFENALSNTTADIAELNWQERLLVRNPPVKDGSGREEKIQEQLRLAAVQFGDLLIARTASY
jgi:hypothetical protein